MAHRQGITGRAHQRWTGEIIRPAGQRSPVHFPAPVERPPGPRPCRSSGPGGGGNAGARGNRGQTRPRSSASLANCCEFRGTGKASPPPGRTPTRKTVGSASSSRRARQTRPGATVRQRTHGRFTRSGPGRGSAGKAPGGRTLLLAGRKRRHRPGRRGRGGAAVPADGGSSGLNGGGGAL